MNLSKNNGGKIQIVDESLPQVVTKTPKHVRIVEDLGQQLHASYSSHEKLLQGDYSSKTDDESLSHTMRRPDDHGTPS